MKFQMPSTWEVYLDISTPDGLADRVTVPLVLSSAEMDALEAFLASLSSQP